MAPATRHRVSYVIPPPTDPVPRLELPPYGTPRHGQPGPLLIYSRADNHHTTTPPTPPGAHHPCHRLGVSALALDTSTQLLGRDTPEGILYTGGRDGMVIAWDVGAPMKERERKYGTFADGRRFGGRWEAMTGWADDAIDEEVEEMEENVGTSGDVLGEVTVAGGSRRRRFSKGEDPIPFEDKWETDMGAFGEGKASCFRQSAQMHSDWVNDVVLCNYNQTVLTASSDGTVKAWSPHSPLPTDPVIVGTHTDYVRCLTYCRTQTWVASGSFDRTIKIWDLSRSVSVADAEPTPLMTLHPPDSSAAKSSVYALAADPYGHTIASGSPERVIRIWDPRSGKRIAKLVGHTDNIRSILISEDARYLLTGSSDASIKLWSLATQRCLHTFTHHTDSVWSLHSTHPALEIFYSGDRTGLVCKVDVEDCADVSEGECVVVCQDKGPEDASLAVAEGINDLVAMDDNLLWTATGASSVRRWRVPPRRAVRAGAQDVESSQTYAESPGGRTYFADTARWRRSSVEGVPAPQSSIRSISPPARGKRESAAESAELYGMPLESLVRLTSANYDPFAGFGGMRRGRQDAEVATLYSAASVMSVPKQARSPIQSVFRPGSALVLRDEGVAAYEGREVAAYEGREVAADAVPLREAPDGVLEGARGLVRSVVLNDRIHALTVDTSGEVAVWDIVRGSCLGRFTREDVAAASHAGSTAGSDSGGSERERSPREALETVRERIEGEAVVLGWSTLDTKTGVLTVHMNERCFEAEIYADEAGYGPERHFNDEIRLTIGKWVLRNLFLNFIREEQRIHRRVRDEFLESQHANNDHRSGHRIHTPSHMDLVFPTRHGSGPPSPLTPTTTRSSPMASTTVFALTTLVPAMAPNLPTTVKSSPLITPMISLNPIRKDTPLSPIPQSPSTSAFEDATPMPLVPLRTATAENPHPAGARDSDYFSRPRASSNVPANAGASTPDELGGWAAGKQEPTTPSAGGFMRSMGRLKKLGRTASSRVSTEIATPSASGQEAPTTPEQDPASASVVPQTPVQVLMAGSLSPPSSSDAPPLPLAPSTVVMLSEEVASGWKTTYRGTVGSTGVDVASLEYSIPTWLAEFLLTNKVPPIPVVKVSFVLLPYQGNDPNERLPELLNAAQSKLTASRFLRVRKLTYHVQDKLDKLTAAAGASPRSTPRSSFDTARRSPSSTSLAGLAASRQKAEENFEILCNDTVLPLDMTLAAIRQFVWKQNGELIMHYRRRTQPAAHSPRLAPMPLSR